jgi:hypothetical protein
MHYVHETGHDAKDRADLPVCPQDVLTADLIWKERAGN